MQEGELRHCRGVQMGSLLPTGRDEGRPPLACAGGNKVSFLSSRVTRRKTNNTQAPGLDTFASLTLHSGPLYLLTTLRAIEPARAFENCRDRTYCS